MFSSSSSKKEKRNSWVRTQKKRLSQRIKVVTGRRSSRAYDSGYEGENVSSTSFDDVFGPPPAPPMDRFEFSNPFPFKPKKKVSEPEEPGRRTLLEASKKPSTTTGFLRELEYGTFVPFHDGEGDSDYDTSDEVGESEDETDFDEGYQKKSKDSKNKGSKSGRSEKRKQAKSVESNESSPSSGYLEHAKLYQKKTDFSADASRLGSVRNTTRTRGTRKKGRDT